MFKPFQSEKSLNIHKEYCGKHESVKIVMPDEGTILKFKNYHRSEKVSFMAYVDFESCNKSIQTCSPDPAKKLYQKIPKTRTS